MTKEDLVGGLTSDLDWFLSRKIRHHWLQVGGENTIFTRRSIRYIPATGDYRPLLEIASIHIPVPLRSQGVVREFLSHAEAACDSNFLNCMVVCPWDRFAEFIARREGYHLFDPRRPESIPRLYIRAPKEKQP